MRKAFLSNLLFVVAINLVIKPIYIFGVEVGVQNTLGAQVYGVYFALLNSAFLLQIINDFGIHIFNNQQVAIDRSRLGALLQGFVALKLILGLIYLSGLVILGYFLGLSSSVPLLFCIGVNLILTSFILFLRSGISGLGYYRLDSLLSVLDKFLMLIIIGSMLSFSGRSAFTISHFVFGQMAALTITIICASVLLHRFSPIFIRWPSFNLLRDVVVKALPYALVVFLMTVYTRIDGVMILKLLDDGSFEAGVYAAGYRILDAVNMVAFLFAALLLPMFSAARDSPPQLKLLLSEGFRYMWFLVVPVVAFGVFFRKAIMTDIYTQADEYWGLVFAILLSNLILMGMMYIFGTLLTALGRIRSMNIVFGITVLLNILLNFWLIPKYKAAGASAATLITQFFAVCGVLVLSYNYYKSSFSVSDVLRVSGFALFCFFIGAVIPSILTSWQWGLLVYCPLVIGAGFCFRLIRQSEVRAIIKKA